MGNLPAVPAPEKTSVQTKKLPGRKHQSTSFEPVVAAAFGRVVRAEREHQQIAQEDFATLAGVNRTNYGRLERGERQPSLGLAFRISEALKISLAVLISRVEDEIARGDAGETNDAA